MEWLTSPPLYRRASTLDIDSVIASVRERLPEVIVSQHRMPYRGDDEGVWWFQIPGSKEDDAEDASIPTSARQWWANTVDEVADTVTTYLSEKVGDVKM